MQRLDANEKILQTGRNSVQNHSEEMPAHFICYAFLGVEKMQITYTVVLQILRGSNTCSLI